MKGETVKLTVTGQYVCTAVAYYLEQVELREKHDVSAIKVIEGSGYNAAPTFEFTVTEQPEEPPR